MAPLLLLALGFSTSGCASVSYLWQAGKGQLAIFNHARPIEEVLRDERPSPRLKSLLREIPKIKEFATAYGIDPTGNFIEYVELGRPAATWVVTASPPLEFRPKEWKFPLVGSFTYIGWFELEDARRFGDGLRAEGLDVDVRGARAYSTLGWFRDPVFSSMIARGDEALGELVNVVIHESVHTTAYVNGQSYFNESLASYVADKLTPLYLDRHFGQEHVSTRAYARSSEDSRKRARELQRVYKDLEALYASDLPAEKKLSEKERLIEAARAKLGIQRPLNNATLIQVRTYGLGEPEFEALYRACGKDFKRFFGAISRIRGDQFSVPQQEDLAAVILPVARNGC